MRELSKEMDPAKSRKRPYRKMAIFAGTLGMLSLGYGFYSDDDSGRLQVTEPSKTVEPAHRSGNSFNILSWNMHNESVKRAAQLKRIAERYKLDAILLQEVSSKDRKKLTKTFPNWWSSYVTADKRTKSTQGGYGNLTMTLEEPEDIRTVSFKGSSLPQSSIRAGKSVFVDTAQLANGNIDFSYLRKVVHQEKRSAISLTVNKESRGHTQKIRLINTHLGPLPKDNGKQFNSLLGFLKKETDNDIPTVFCGDLNRAPEQVIPELSKQQFITEQVGSTSLEGFPLDYCSYITGGSLGLGKVEKQDGVLTDHHALFGSWPLHKIEDR